MAISQRPLHPSMALVQVTTLVKGVAINKPTQWLNSG
jgi:hypothetical protein